MRALSDGSTSVLTAATTCATAGIIVGVVTLTGLGLKFSSIVIDYAGGSLLLTAIYTALIVWIVGLAVPVTASYIICAVIAAPAMIKLGVPDFAAHMFIFYYSVLSEVSPPTALSPFAAAAITGGDPYKTTLQAWKYTLPAFLVPFVFVLDPQGIGLLLKLPKDGSWIDIVSDHGQDRARPGGAGRGGAGLGAAQDDHDRTPAAGAGRPVAGVPEPARSVDGSLHRPRHQLHRDIWLGDRRRSPAKTTHARRRSRGHKRSGQQYGRNAMMKRKGLVISALAVSAALLAGAAFAQQGLNIAIATGGTGGVYYPLGGGMANVLSKHVPGMQATARVTGGSVDNLKLIGSQQSEVALVMVDAALDALKGEDKFKGSPVEVRTLMVLYPNRMHVVTIEGTGIEKMSDLKGKRVSTGSPGSATEVMAFRVIEAAGLDKDKDMRRERLGVAESVNALKDRKIDAFFWVGGLPTAAVTDLGATPNVKIKLIDHADAVDKMNAKYSNLYTTGVIPAKTYPGQDKDNEIAVVQNILVANAKMADKVAYDIVKTFIESATSSSPCMREAESITLDNQSAEELTDPVASRRGEIFHRRRASRCDAASPLTPARGIDLGSVAKELVNGVAARGRSPFQRGGDRGTARAPLRTRPSWITRAVRDQTFGFVMTINHLFLAFMGVRRRGGRDHPGRHAGDPRLPGARPISGCSSPWRCSSCSRSRAGAALPERRSAWTPGSADS